MLRSANTRLTFALFLAVGIVGSCGGTSPRSNVEASAPPADISTTPATVASGPSDSAVCSGAFSQISDYHPSEVVRALGANAADVRSWLVTRPESLGTAPDRGLTNAASDARVVICIIKGDFSIPSPEPQPAPADAGRFIILPTGAAVLDAAGPLQRLLDLTPTAIPAATRVP